MNLRKKPHICKHNGMYHIVYSNKLVHRTAIFDRLTALMGACPIFVSVSQGKQIVRELQAERKVRDAPY